MKLLKRFFEFYLDASIHAALGGVSLYFLTLEVLQLSTNWSLALFLFFGTIVGYNFIKFGVEAKKYVIVSNPYHKWIQGFSFVSFVIAVYFFFQLEQHLWPAIVILATLSTLYAIPFLPTLKNLRSVGGLKTFLVAFIWVGCTVYLPLKDNYLELGWVTLGLFTERFILVLILLLPFEIRDLKLDDPELKTIPQRLGVKKTKILGYVMVLCYFLLSFLNDGLSGRVLVSKLLISMILILILKKTKGNQSPYFSSFLVEALPVLFWGIVVVIKIKF